MSSASPPPSPRARAPSCSTRPTILPAVSIRQRSARSRRAAVAPAHPPLVISDEPYKQLVFDGKQQPEVAALIANTAICYSWSKAQALAGERIGYLALSPRLPDVAAMAAACTFANRMLGFMNAPAHLAVGDGRGARTRAWTSPATSTSATCCATAWRPWATTCASPKAASTCFSRRPFPTTWLSCSF